MAMVNAYAVNACGKRFCHEVGYTVSTRLLVLAQRCCVNIVLVLPLHRCAAEPFEVSTA
jgi:hypothetical protein